MTEFATWVQPIAASYHDAHLEAIQRARMLNAGELALPTGDRGWSVRDELAHMAASDEDFIATLGAVLDGKQVDFSVFADIDARNARNLDAWSTRSVEDIASALERSDAALQELLARLTPEDEQRTPEGFPFPLSQMLQGYGMHHPYHLEQISGALAGRAEQARP